MLREKNGEAQSMAQVNRVAIIVLNWNQYEDTVECLESLRAIKTPNCHVIIVDNGSVDGSPDRIEHDFPEITLLRNEQNLGFAEGNNVGIRHALADGATHVFLLNNDTIVAPDVVDELLWACEQDPKIAAVGAVNYSYYDRGRIISGGGRINWLTSTHRQVLPAKADEGVRVLLDADFVGGSAIMITRGALERVGLLDGEYFNFFEEADWCVRAGGAGLRVACLPSAKVWHKVSAALPSAANAYFCARNGPRFMARNAPRAVLPFYYVYYVAALVSLRAVVRRLVGRQAEGRATWLGFVDAVARRYGAGRIDEVARRSGSSRAGDEEDV